MKHMRLKPHVFNPFFLLVMMLIFIYGGITESHAQSIATTGLTRSGNTPIGWSRVNGTCDSANNTSWLAGTGYTYPISPRLYNPAGIPNGYLFCAWTETASTTITGLTVGTKYSLSIYAANHPVVIPYMGTTGTRAAWKYSLTNASGVAITPSSAPTFKTGFKGYVITWTATSSSATLTLGTELSSLPNVVGTLGRPTYTYYAWGVGTGAVGVVCTKKYWYQDWDGDGYGTSSVYTYRCDKPSGYVANDLDCNDGNASVYPGATEIIGDSIDQSCDGRELCYTDADNDGYRTNATRTSTDSDCSDSGEARSTEPAGDCNDSNAAINPGASEIIGDENDQNCDGRELCYANNDNDGYRTSSTISSADTDCRDSREARSSVPAGDCNDYNASAYPGATERVGDGVDQNCDGREICYNDSDNDGYRLTTTRTSSDSDCSDSGEAFSSEPAGDCRDNNASINPGASEVPGDEQDQNCDGRELCYVDKDSDGYRGTATTASSDLDCRDSGEYLASYPSGDCNDANASIYPGATELIGDGIDQSCDGRELCYVDADNDGYRIGSTLNSSDADCADNGEALASEPTGDCNDSVASINPGATEIVGDEVDQTCDGIELCYTDADNDTYRSNAPQTSADVDCTGSGEARASDPSGDCNDADASIYPGATELVGDDIDQSCDGKELCYVNADNDGYRIDATVTSSDDDCADGGEARASLASGDCDDTDSATYPGATEVIGDSKDQSCDGQEVCYIDGDSDGYRGTGTVTSADADCFDSGEAAASMASGDCNDTEPTINPGATELIADGIDQNCDGKEVCYIDADSDGWRLTTTKMSADADCTDSGEASATLPTGDCDDSVASINPGATERIGDETDQDCDGTELCFWDADGDNWRTNTSRVSSDLDCDDAFEAAASVPALDCDDQDSKSYPGATEVVADEKDQDCDGTELCYENSDGDLWRTSNTVVSTNESCADAGEAPASIAVGDCDDGDASIYPGATEVIGDEADQNCDGTELCYVDGDDDGWRLDTTLTSADLDCTDTGEATAADPTLDCDDADNTVYPTATERPGDEFDQNCDDVELCYTDIDADGWRTDSTITSTDMDCTDTGEAVASMPDADCDDTDDSVYPGAVEIPYDGIDQDCDGSDVCDLDGDGFAASARACGGTDCDDDDAAVNPDAVEVYYDGVDQDCDGWSDYDADGDGFDSAEASLLGDDCDDDNDEIYPGAEEIWYDDIDQDCDEGSDYDADGDGYDSAEYGGTDCDDDNETTYPGAPELMDGIDNDCNGLAEDDDTDGDGLPDEVELRLGTDVDDADSDGDGLLDGDEVSNWDAPDDTDGDGAIDALDDDDDGDGIPTSDELDDNEQPLDSDDDGQPNHRDVDSDGDGWDDEIEGDVDSDGDGLPDYLDEDSDNDTVLDEDERDEDTDADGVDNRIDDDDDGDQWTTEEEQTWPEDVDGDGIPNYLDTDSDDDGRDDIDEQGDEDCDDLDDVIDADHEDGTCGGAGGDEGCGCATASSTPLTGALGLLLVSLVLLRRRCTDADAA